MWIISYDSEVDAAAMLTRRGSQVTQRHVGCGAASAFMWCARSPAREAPALYPRRVAGLRHFSAPGRSGAARRRGEAAAARAVRSTAGGRLYRVDGGTAQFPLCEKTQAREASVPYTAASDGTERERLCRVAVNGGAEAAIREAGAERFAAVIDPRNPRLTALLEAVATGWSINGERSGGRGHHSAWPELFELGAELIKEHFPDEAEEVLSGCGFVREGDDLRNAIDFIQRRPQGDFFITKFHHARRCHRDVDARDYKSEGWLDEACPEPEKYSYRFYNIWLARSALDPTCQVWEDPLLLLLPREGGRREWPYEAVTEADREAAKAKAAEEGAKGWSPARMLTEAIGAASRATTWSNYKRERGTSEAGVDPYFEARGQPELLPDEAHSWVTAPFMIFDSADVWHSAGKWENEFKRELRSKHLKGNKSESIGGRVSIELRYRVRRRIDGGSDSESNGDGDGASPQWSPLSCALRSEIELNRKLRSADLLYDLEAGTAVEVKA